MKARKEAVNTKHDLGMQTRVAVLGKEAAGNTAMNEETFKPARDFITEAVWANVWARPGMPWKTRLLVNIGILAAMDRPSQLERYMRGAIRNGCTKEEVVEVLLQVGAYCGAPALVEGCKAAKRAFQGR